MMDADEFSKAKSMIFPRDILVGHGTLPQITRMCDDFGFRHTGMIITGKNTYASAGKQIEEYIKDAKNKDGSEKYEISTHFTGEATQANVDRIIEEAKERKVKFLIGVGGGSKIDLAKLAASKLSVPFISVPTSASHDGIASGRASLKMDYGPLSIDAVTPMGVLADSAVIAKAPYRYLASGCADVISNLSALKDWKYANRLRNVPFSSSAYALAELSANTILEHADDIKPGLEESVWIAMKPIIISGVAMAVAGSSRPTSGAEHMFSHALDIYHPGSAMHGEQCGVGCIMMMYLHDGDSDDKNRKSSWEIVRDALEKIGAPVNAKDLGLKSDEIIDALVKAHNVRKDKRFTILGEHGIDEKTAEVVAKKTKVI